jgi:hypothetical protein
MYGQVEYVDSIAVVGDGQLDDIAANVSICRHMQSSVSGSTIGEAQQKTSADGVLTVWLASN